MGIIIFKTGRSLFRAQDVAISIRCNIILPDAIVWTPVLVPGVPIFLTDLDDIRDLAKTLCCRIVLEAFSEYFSWGTFVR